MKQQNGGRVARTAGLVITTSIATASIQSATWEMGVKGYLTFLCIAIGALLAAMASDFDGEQP